MNNEEGIIAYLIGDMDAAQRLAFEQDVQSSIELANELEEYKKVFGIIENIESTQLPESATERFNKMLDSEIKTLQDTQTKVVSMPSNYLRMIGIAASFALFGLFIGYHLQNNGLTESVAIELSADQKKEFIQLVGQPRTSKKIDGLDLLGNVTSLDNDVIVTLEDVLFNDLSTNVRLAVIDALKGHIEQQEIKDIMIKGLRTIDKPMVKIGLIQALSNTQSRQYIPDLELELQQDGLDAAVRDELHVGIMKLSKNS